MKVMMTKTVLLAGILLVWPGLVWADLVGTYDLTEGDMMIVEYHDENNFRINMGPQGYVLMNQGTAYIVSKQNGEWEAMSVESMRAMMSRMGFGQQMEKTITDHTPPKFEDTGRTERHAGITGKVYLLTTSNPDGTTETAEMVFGEDPRLLTLQEANIRVAEAWENKGQSRQGPSFGEIMKKFQGHGPSGGILRYDNAMRLVSLQETELAPSRFALPRVKNMEFPAGAMPPSTQQQVQTQNPVTTVPPPPAPPKQDGRISKGAKRIGDRAAKKTEDTISKNVEDGVQEGVDSFIKGIFGN